MFIRERKVSDLERYEKKGYLNSNFKMFHLIDQEKKEFSFHYHDFNKILIFIRGDVTYCIEGCSYALKPYDVVFVKAGEVHRPIVERDIPYERIIIYVSPDFINSYQEADYDLAYCFKKAEEEKSNVLRMNSLHRSKLYEVTCELEQSFLDSDYASELYHNVLFLEFMIQLNRAALHNFINYVNTNTSNPKIIDMLEYLNTNLSDDISIDSLADKFYISKYYLMHTFKDETGYTIGNYLTTKRLLHARDLIQTGTPITEACFACGFKNYSTFSRAYKKYFKKTPREF